MLFMDRYFYPYHLWMDVLIHTVCGWMILSMLNVDRCPKDPVGKKEAEGVLAYGCVILMNIDSYLLSRLFSRSC